MKKIKIKILQYDPKDVSSYGYYIVNMLKKSYEIEFSENPDYLFFNESQFDHVDYSCVKIFYTGENIYPDFNICDYALAFNYIDFKDRYIRFPIYFVLTFHREKELKMIEELASRTKDAVTMDKEGLAKKEGFCSFVYSNYLADTQRKDFFDKLSAYKKVSSGGAYLNNVGGRVDNKLGFEIKHKFSIAFENSSNDGYTTEKLPNALTAQTIPIYWGNPLVGKEFNTKRFINCHDFKDFDAVVEKVKEIDSNDDLYLEMINQPMYTEGYIPKNIEADFEKFLKNIFDQPLSEARRIKINPAREYDMIKNLKMIRRMVKIKNRAIYISSRLYKPFKNIKLLDTFKKRYFAKKIYK